MDYTVNLKIEDYRTLVNALSIVSTFVDDVDMRNGLIRQGNISKTLVLSMDISSVFPYDLCTSNVKAKLPLLQLILDDGKDVEFSCQTKTYQVNGQERSEKAWYVNNGVSVFKFLWSDSNKLSTKYVEEQMFNDKFLAYTKDPIVEIDMSSKPELKKKIKKVSDSFNNDKIYMKTDEESWALVSISMDKRADAKILSEKFTDLTVIDKCYEVQTKVDFINVDAELTKLIYYKPGTCVNDKEPGRQVGTSFVVSESALNDKIKFSTYNFSRCYVSDAAKKTVSKQSQPVVVPQPEPVVAQPVQATVPEETPQMPQTASVIDAFDDFSV